MTNVLACTDDTARKRRFQPFEDRKSPAALRRNTGRSLIAAGLIIGIAGAVSLTAIPIATTSAQAFEFGHIAYALKQGVDSAGRVSERAVYVADGSGRPVRVQMVASKRIVRGLNEFRAKAKVNAIIRAHRNATGRPTLTPRPLRKSRRQPKQVIRNGR